MKLVPKRSALIPTLAVTTAAVAVVGWLWFRPLAPIDTPYFSWQEQSDHSYELVVSHADGNPEFRQGVMTTPVPHSGPLRVRGAPGAASPGAWIEVSNPRTGQGYQTTADATGAFAVTVESRKGDSLTVLSRRMQLRAPAPPRYSSTDVSRR